jgi:histidinol-phosphate aminotransferase
MYITVGDPILILGPTYDNFRLTSQTQGAIVHYFNYDEQFNLNEFEFIETIKQLSPSLVYICNPNNPTGSLISKAYLKKLVSQFPDIIFLVDEAYYEFAGETMANEVINYANLFISSTFSKAFALANFRAGYLISDTNNIQQISKIRNPKNFTTFAQEAVIGVLSDIEYMTNYVQEVISSREWFIDELNMLPYVEHVYSSHANFILVRFTSFDNKMKVFNHYK